MRIYLVRHGQTAWNKVGRWQGNQEVPLDEVGIEQTMKLASKLSQYRVGKIYASPLKRVAMSADILREKIGGEIVYSQGLREVHLGEWEGYTSDEIIENYGELFHVWVENPAAQIGFGVENILDLQDRAYKEFEEIASHEKEDIIIVSHGTWTRCLLCKLLNIPLENRRGFEVSNTGISVIDCDAAERPPRFTVITLNDVSHLV